jgi:hypothetical protein
MRLMRAKHLVYCTVAAALVTSIAVQAQQGGAPGGGGAAPAPAPKPMIPMAASSIILSPDTYVGENVSMMGSVDAILSKTVFTVDQDKTSSTGKDVIVIAPNIQQPVQPNAYLTIQGEVFKFDAAEVAKRSRNQYALDLTPEQIAKYQGKPAVFATGIITAQLVDIGKRQPPPLTAGEQLLRAAMMAISTDVAKAKEQIAALKKAFTDAEAFFKSQSAPDAVDWAGQALKSVAAMEAATAAATPKWEDVRTAATTVGGLCGPCHAARRERLEDGSYRFKK